MTAANPFPPHEPDRQAIWELLVARDSAFFLGADWALVADDYGADGFFGVDAGGSADPDSWRLAFPTVAAYRDAAIAARWRQDDFAEPLPAAWHRCQTLTRIDIAGEMALAHKRIDGSIRRTVGEPLLLRWRSVFHLRRADTRWQIAGFIGYLPL